MRTLLVLIACLAVSFTSFSQSDSLLQVQWNASLKKLAADDFTDAALGFTQLINSGFANKEVYVKRGISYYRVKQYDKAKADFDDAVKARINTQELFEFRGHTKYALDDFQGAATELEKAVSMGASSFE